MFRKPQLHKLAIIIDVIGGIFTTLAITAFFFPDLLPEKYLSFFQNFGVEMMGTWVSVRLIDFFVEQRAKATAARVKVLRHSRFWLINLFPLTGRPHYRDQRRLKRELEYTSYMHPRWAKYLEASEAKEFYEFIEGVKLALIQAEQLGLYQDHVFDLCSKFRESYTAKAHEMDTNGSEALPAFRTYPEMEAVLRSIERLVTDHIYENSYESVSSKISEKCERLLILAQRASVSIDIEALNSAATQTVTLREEISETYKRMEAAFTELERDVREETIEE